MIARSVPAQWLILAALALAPNAGALETRIGEDDDSRVVLRADEVVEDNLLITGDTVVLEGAVTGNLIAAARRIEFRGEVQGDLLTAAAEIEAEGRVGGNWLSFSRDFVSSAEVARSLAAFAETVEFSGSVEDDFAGFASRVTLAGPVGVDAFLFAGDAEARSTVGRDLKAWANRVTLDPPAAVEGDLIARVATSDSVVVHPDAEVGGSIQTVLPDDQPETSRYLQPSFYLGLLVSFLAAWLTGCVLFWLAPGWLVWTPGSPRDVALAGGVGFLVLVATPVAAVLALISVIGLPLGLGTLAAWGAALYVAKIIVAIPVGAAVAGKAAPGDFRGAASALAFGLAVYFLLRLIPFIGGLLAFIVVLVGLGAAVNQARARMTAASP